jgi:hypothetical protein
MRRLGLFSHVLFDPPQDATNLRGEKCETEKFDHHEPECNGRNQTYGLYRPENEESN